MTLITLRVTYLCFLFLFFNIEKIRVFLFLYHCQTRLEQILYFQEGIIVCRLLQIDNFGNGYGKVFGLIARGRLRKALLFPKIISEMETGV